MAGMVKERYVGSMEEILDQCQCGLCYYAGMAILEEGVRLGTYILTYKATQQSF